MTTEEPSNKNFSNLSLDQYQLHASSTAIYKDTCKTFKERISYVGLGLSGEAGEIANKTKKLLRDKELDKEALIAELGDVLWYLAMTCNELDTTLNEVANINLYKLKQRKQKGTLKGKGDNR